VVGLLLCLLVVCLTTISLIQNTHIMANGWMIVNNEMEGCWRELFWTGFKVLLS
jgi:hypothetical protein